MPFQALQAEHPRRRAAVGMVPDAPPAAYRKRREKSEPALCGRAANPQVDRALAVEPIDRTLWERCAKWRRATSAPFVAVEEVESLFQPLRGWHRVSEARYFKVEHARKSLLAETVLAGRVGVDPVEILFAGDQHETAVLFRDLQH